MRLLTILVFSFLFLNINLMASDLADDIKGDLSPHQALTNEQHTPAVPGFLDGKLNGDCFKYLLEFLPLKSKHNLSIVSKNEWQFVMMDRMGNDPRQLQFNPWVEGPALGSLELYRLNAAVLHAQRVLILAASIPVQSTPLIPYRYVRVAPLSDAYTFILNLLPEHLKERHPALLFIQAAMSYYIETGSFEFNPPQKLVALGLSRHNKNEFDLMRVNNFMLNKHHRSAFFEDYESNPDRMSLPQRYLLISEIIQKIKSSADSPELKAQWGEYVLKYGLQIDININPYIAKAYMACSNYQRAAQLYNAFLKNRPYKGTIYIDPLYSEADKCYLELQKTGWTPEHFEVFPHLTNNHILLHPLL